MHIEVPKLNRLERSTRQPSSSCKGPHDSRGRCVPVALSWGKIAEVLGSLERMIARTCSRQGLFERYIFLASVRC